VLSSDRDFELVEFRHVKYVASSRAGVGYPKRVDRPERTSW